MNINQIKARINELRQMHGCCVPYTDEEKKELVMLYARLRELTGKNINVGDRVI